MLAALRSMTVLGMSLACVAGCCHEKYQRASVVALPASPANQCEPAGIPFYLPKPLLVVSKNVYHIEEPTVGLTDSAPIPDNFDAQAQYGDVNARSSHAITDQAGSGGVAAPAVPGSGTASKSAPKLHSDGAPLAPHKPPKDGLAPHQFFTYEMVFVPDLTQKYVLQVTGGPGEMRAAMNLVNGWQFTGLGPYYLKDSSTAQNILSRGIAINLGLSGAADVVNSVANLASQAAANGGAVRASEVKALTDALDQAATEETIDWNAFDDLWTERLVQHGDGSQSVERIPPKIERYAQVFVYEPYVVNGQMLWQPVVQQSFDREFLGAVKTSKSAATPAAVRALMESMEELPAPRLESQSLNRLPPIDSKVVAQVLSDTLHPQPPEKKRFFGRRKATVENRQVDAVVQ